jgi:hypothetical protein
MRIAVGLIDVSTGEPVQAELFDDVTIEDFLQTQRDWRPLVLEAAQRLTRAGDRPSIIPQHFHWDWTRKEGDLRMLANRFYGIRREDKLQGLAKLMTVGHVCRLPEQAGKPLVYVDYLEVAPWNIKPLMTALGRPHRFAGVGTRLVEIAVRLSVDEGFRGRLGLHSLPTSEPFYINTCAMTPVGPDATKQNLTWCEFTPAQADGFLGR